HVEETIAKSPIFAPEIPGLLLNIRGGVPTFVRVTAMAPLVVLSTTLPNDTLAGSRLTTGAAVVVPVPVSVTNCEPVPALSLMVILPLRVPVAAGVNVTEIVQLRPGATTPTQLSVSVKLPAATMLDTVMAPPEFVSVMSCAALVTPTAVAGNVRLAGDALAEGWNCTRRIRLLISSATYRLSDPSTARKAGLSKLASTASPPSPANAAMPLPATVVMVPVAAYTRRIRPLLLSEIKRLPNVPKAIPRGLLSLAAVAG